MKDLLICVPVYNEEGTIQVHMQALFESVLHFCKKQIVNPENVEIRYCFNGTTDASEGKWDKILMSNPYFQKKVHKYTSTKGKINAQRRMLVGAKVGFKHILFIDADAVIAKDTIVKLHQNLLDGGTRLVYGNMVPIASQGFLPFLQRVHYSHQDEILTPRNYFHGRCFMIQAEDVDAFFDTRSLEKKDLTDGFRVDDIHLSRYYAHEYGPKSMKHVSDAAVQFQMISSLRDYYRAMKRLHNEIYRLNILFPEHKYLQKEYFVRKIDWKKLRRLSWRTQFHYIVYKLFDSTIKRLAKTSIRAELSGVKRRGEMWKPTTSTKKSII